MNTSSPSSNGIVIGVDVAQNTLDIATSDRTRVEHLAYDQATLNALVRRWRRHTPQLIVMEATGGLERRLAHHLLRAGLAVAIVNPAQIRCFARAAGQTAKTDAIDARLIARYGQLMQPRPSELPDEHELKLTALISRRRQVVRMRTAEKNRLSRTGDPAMRRLIRQAITLYSNQLERLNSEIAAILETNETMRQRAAILQSVPGVGATTAGTLIAELPELGHANRQEIARIVGVAPINRDSGLMRGKRITGGGRTHVRKTLYMATLVATRHNPTIRDFYLRLQAQGKCKMTALVAAMRKLLTILNLMIRDNTSWNPQPNT